MRKTSLLVFLTLLLLGTFSYAYGAEDGVETPDEQPFKPVLLVIDIQNEYLPYMADEDKELGLQMINAAIALFREKDLPVVAVYHTDPEYGPSPDSEGFQFPATINIQDGDAKIVKNHPSAFTNTELESVLRDAGGNTLFLCGLSAVGCVLATYFGAMDKDFEVFLVKHALISHNARYTDSVEEMFDSVSYKTLKTMLKCAEE